jgi:hypothetical protein
MSCPPDFGGILLLIGGLSLSHPIRSLSLSMDLSRLIEIFGSPAKQLAITVAKM